MPKDFDAWNSYKKNLVEARNNLPIFEREIWWCSIGVNVGSEQDGTGANFSRPVLIFKKINQNLFWGIPLSTKIQRAPERYSIDLKGIINDILLFQLRVLDKKRLSTKKGRVSKTDYKNIQALIVKFIEL